MEIRMKPDVRPFIAKVRRYVPTHRAFMSAQVAKMEEQGIIYRNKGVCPTYRIQAKGGKFSLHVGLQVRK
jgi:hypothetical protein